MADDKQPLLLNNNVNKSFGRYGGVMDYGLNESETSRLNVQRPVYQIEDLNRDHLYEKPYTSFKQKCSNGIKSVKAMSCLLRTIPVLNWLPKYHWKKHFGSDLISGGTVAVMHIPQGMAYAFLGGVPPIVGIYMAFFPVLMYFMFGTSRHISIGTFAIICLMTGKVVQEHSTVEILQNGTVAKVPGADPSAPPLTNIEVACTVTFVVAMIQFAMYILRLGIVSTLLSETLVNGFICGCAFHVASSQLKDLFGLTIVKRRGMFAFLLTVYEAALDLPNANRYACAISLIFCVAMSINNELLKPWLAKRTNIPFPIELMAVIAGTCLSYFLSLENAHGIGVVGRIPRGLPDPALPAFYLMPKIFLDCVVITMVSYTVSMSMALIFARKAMYEIDANQELLALGAANTMGSFFSCMPICASLSRSMIQTTVGGKTQIASIVSCSILIFVLLWIGPIFETLPRCVLACIILVALKGMLLQCTSIAKYWKLSKWDAAVWIVTFCTTLCIQIGVGLAAGVCMSLLSLFVQGNKPYTCLLGVVPNTDLYLDTKRYKGVQEIPGIKIFHYSGSLSFASKAAFREALIRKTGFDVAKILRRRSLLNDKEKASQSGASAAAEEEMLVKCVILDFSALTYVDPSGVDMLRQFQADYAKLDIALFIAGCSGPVYETFINCDRYSPVTNKFVIFPTIHDAVLYAESHVIRTKKA